jgi:hypothetical protein
LGASALVGPGVFILYIFLGVSALIGFGVFVSRIFLGAFCYGND